MPSKLIEFLQTLKEVLEKSSIGTILFIIGVTGGTARLMIDGGKKHTYGQRFLIVLMGGIISYLVGGIAEEMHISYKWLSFIGFFCGMFGYSVMKYVIDNEQSAFHTTANYFSKFLDIIINRVADWLVPKKSSDQQNETENETENTNAN